MSDPPRRDRLPDDETWDLARIYPTTDDWERAADALSDRAAALQDRESPADSPESLAAALAAVADALVARSRLELYAQLRRDEDDTDDDRRDRYRRATRIGADVDEAVRAVRRRIQRAADRAREHRGAPALAGWEPYLDDVLDRAAHTRGPEAESVIAAFEPVVEDVAGPVVAAKTRDFDPPTVDRPGGDAGSRNDGGADPPDDGDGGPDADADADGGRESGSEAGADDRATVTVGHGDYPGLMADPDRAFRRRVYRAYRDALADHEGALAAAVTAKVDAHAALAAARNFESVRAMALSRPSYPRTGMHVAVDPGLHDAVLDRVRGHRGAYHDLLESRRRCLGVESLRPWDGSAPLVDGDPPEMAYGEAREHVLAAVEPLGEAYRERLAAFLDAGRVDVRPTERKRSDVGAYAASSPETGAFVLANYRGSLRSAFTLAHELGHAMHVELLRAAQPPRYVNSPQPVSEVPSLVHELLLADRLRAAGDPGIAPFVRERRARLLAGNVYGAGLSATVLHEYYRTVEDGGELTPARLAATYAEHARTIAAPVAPDPAAADGDGDAHPRGAGWRRQNYARQPYHYYQYVLGAVTAVAVVGRLRGGDLAPATYREFLEATGRRDAAASLSALGVDPTAAAPYERLADDLDGIRAARPE